MESKQEHNQQQNMGFEQPPGAYPPHNVHPHPPPPYSQTQSQGYPQQGYPQQGYPQQGYPQQGFQQQQFTQQQYTNVGYQPTAVYAVNSVRVGPEPCGLSCPSCHQHIVTKLDYETSTKTHIMAAILCAFVCWPCAWIPYVMDSCKNANHYCPNCGCFIGTYKS